MQRTLLILKKETVQAEHYCCCRNTSKYAILVLICNISFDINSVNRLVTLSILFLFILSQHVAGWISSLQPNVNGHHPIANIVLRTQYVWSSPDRKCCTPIRYYTLVLIFLEEDSNIGITNNQCRRPSPRVAVRQARVASLKIAVLYCIPVAA